MCCSTMLVGTLMTEPRFTPADTQSDPEGSRLHAPLRTGHGVCAGFSNKSIVGFRNRTSGQMTKTSVRSRFYVQRTAHDLGTRHLDRTLARIVVGSGCSAKVGRSCCCGNRQIIVVFRLGWLLVVTAIRLTVRRLSTLIEIALTHSVHVQEAHAMKKIVAALTYALLVTAAFAQTTAPTDATKAQMKANSEKAEAQATANKKKAEAQSDADKAQASSNEDKASAQAGADRKAARVTGATTPSGASNARGDAVRAQARANQKKHEAQAKADRKKHEAAQDANVAQAKANKKKVEAQDDANKKAADANVDAAKKQ